MNRRMAKGVSKLFAVAGGPHNNYGYDYDSMVPSRLCGVPYNMYVKNNDAFHIDFFTSSNFFQLPTIPYFIAIISYLPHEHEQLHNFAQACTHRMTIICCHHLVVVGRRRHQFVLLSMYCYWWLRLLHFPRTNIL